MDCIAGVLELRTSCPRHSDRSREGPGTFARSRWSIISRMSVKTTRVSLPSFDPPPSALTQYTETGFCGFGDTCKFLHDRGDYLHGWQLDNSFLSSNAAAGSFLAKQAARAAGDEPDPEDPENEDLPFACLICRKTFGSEPIVTLCGHYFDAACAVKRYSKTGKCFACGKSTNGVFNKFVVCSLIPTGEADVLTGRQN